MCKYAPRCNPDGLDMIHGPKAKNGSGPRQILDVQFFERSLLISDEFGHGTSSIGMYISLPFQAAKERPNWMLYATWESVLIWTTPRRVGLWILKLLLQFWSNPILVGHGTDFIGNLMSSSFCPYVEHPNLMSYASCTSI
jgi:hypothetical protein